MREANLLLAVCSDEGPEKSPPSRKLAKGVSGGRGSFQVGQTAKARSGYRVQSLPEGTRPPVWGLFYEFSLP